MKFLGPAPSAAQDIATKGYADSVGGGGMLQPVLCVVPGNATYTIVDGSVTEIAETSFYSPAITPVVGDRLLVIAAPAASGPGTLYVATTQPANGVYEVTGTSGKLTVTRAADLSGSINPMGKSVYILTGSWKQTEIFTVTDPANNSTFTYGTTPMGWDSTGGNTPWLSSIFIDTSVGLWNGSGATFVSAEWASADVNTLIPPFDGRMATQGALIRQRSAYTLTSATTVQKLFNTSTNGRVSLPVGLYKFQALYSLSGMSSTSGNSKFSLDVSGAAISNVLMMAVGVDGNAATAATLTGSTATSAAFPASQHTAGTGTTQQSFINGTFEVTTAGFIIPSITLVTASAAVVAAGSYFEVTPLSIDPATVTYGSWT